MSDAHDSTPAESEEVCCRLCFDSEIDPVGDPFLVPCKCAGSMKFIHSSCLFESRVNSLDPKTISECGLCKTVYRTVDTQGMPQDSQSAKRELYMAIARYLGVRIGSFCACVIVLGFLPWLLDFLGYDAGLFASLGFDPEYMLPASLQGRGVVPHLGRGFISTLACAGGWAVMQVFASLGAMRIPFFDRTGSSGRRDNNAGAVLVLLCAVGAAYLLWELFKGAYALVRDARAVATGAVRGANREARTAIAERYRVINFAPPAQPDVD